MNRLLSDTFSIMIMSLVDPGFRASFSGAQTADESFEFWRKNMRYGQIEARLKEVESALGFPAEVSEMLSASRVRELRHSSAYVHALFMPAVLTTFVPSAARRGTMQLGIIGHPNLASVGTVVESTNILWYFTTLIFKMLQRPLAKSGMPPYPFNKRKLSDRMAVVAYHAFHDTILAHWDDTEGLDPFETEAGTSKRPRRAASPRRRQPGAAQQGVAADGAARRR